LAVPLAIVIAGGLIAVALYFSNRNSGAPVVDNQPAPVAEKIRGIQKNDHVRGNPNAPVVIVEFSDTECPFCKQFHGTMKQVMSNYGTDGKVAWVYRHFPLPQLHPKAPHEAEALECASELGGNDAFWKYTDKIYEVTPSNNGLDPAQLPAIATQIGLDKTAFMKCLDSGKYKARVDKDAAEAVAAGGQGTPHSIILYAGEQVPVEGAQPFQVLKNMIDTLLAGKKS
ncbi:thioredoxin domain-containing protein, partial [Candidatus Kaiserbacteria bacterium]|nr:thioredoxin domain-containing protein [Candidatus Kaiserbacteria bacterium]